MKELEELDILFKSPTIKPSFEDVHVILALYIFEKHPEGIGRYRLKNELSIGEGTTKSLIKKLSRDIHFLEIKRANSGEKSTSKRSGHVLTELGKNFLKKIKRRIPIIEKGDISILKELIVGSPDSNPYFCLIKNASEKITNGVEQRDAAIKVNGSGATCLVYIADDLVFPESSFSEDESNQTKVRDEVLNYFKSKIVSLNEKLEQSDVIIIGLGNDKKISRLAALNSALTLI